MVVKFAVPSARSLLDSVFGGSRLDELLVQTDEDPDGPLKSVPNMCRTTHVGIYVSYLCVGLIYGSGQAVIYPIVVILNHEENNYQQAVSLAFTFFWGVKIFYGFLSDNIPVFGLRRKPYLLLGWSVAIAASLVLAILCQLSGSNKVCQSAKRVFVECDPVDATLERFEVPALPLNSLVGLMMLNNFGYVMADVAMDSMAIEFAQREPLEQRGTIQGMCYTSRALGFIIACAITGFGLNGPLYGGSFSSELSLSTYLWILVALQAVGLPWWICLQEDKVDPIKIAGGVSRSLSKAWALMKNSTFSKMMLFNVFMNVCQQVTVAARTSVLDTWVHMSPLTYSLDQLQQNVVMMLTLFVATKYCKNLNWRVLLVAGTFFYVIVMFLFWLVVFDVVRDPWLVIFIDADQTFAQNIGYLVVMWACVEMAPDGLEGTTLALATTVSNAGQALGNYVAMGFNACFALTRADISADSEYTRKQYMYNSLAVMGVQCLYMILLTWVPNAKVSAKAQFLQGRQSVPLAVLAVVFVVFALLWGSSTTIAALFCPCSRILGGSGCGANGCSS